MLTSYKKVKVLAPLVNDGVCHLCVGICVFGILMDPKCTLELLLLYCCLLAMSSDHIFHVLLYKSLKLLDQSCNHLEDMGTMST